jgi:methylisocitrate lyase
MTWRTFGADLTVARGPVERMPSDKRDKPEPAPRDSLESGPESLRKLIEGKKAVVAPGVFSPAVAKLAEKEGFRAVYLSGAGFSNQMALPDLGMTTLTEVARATREIASQVGVPLVVDADTGFGEAVNCARTVKELEAAGAAALHIEDQVLPKKCGHLEGKEIVDADEMVKKIVSAKEASSGIIVIARTDARAVEGIDGALERATLYAKAGADMIFPEALESRAEFVEFRRKVKLPLMANMTEFGKTPYMTADDFDRMGYNVVIFPVTAFRAAMKAVESTFRRLKKEGTQGGMLDALMSRDEFNRLIDYHGYEAADRKALETARRVRGAAGRS